ncbi:MAG: 30S ribosomal protein S12 methylthiotransferase RimO [Candidatus Delongbacteria bacterium]|nr:30S ribosomal protein S12 methylthiotransferase RimO [Candidatus Delongbacteria bacterium]
MKTEHNGRLRLYIHTVGCAKNLVDSEVLAGELARNYEMSEKATEADIVIVNTCGFIEQASEASVEAVLEATALKKQGSLQAVYVMGCLTQKHGAELQREIPQLDGVVGVNQFGQLLQKLVESHPHSEVTHPLPDMFIQRQLATPAHYSHLRISDGCNHKCTYCAIPTFRGGYSSRPATDLLAEAAALEARGVRELLVIGQEITSWGQDLPGGERLPDLLQRLDRETGFDWLRLMYTHPPDVNQQLITAIAELPRILPYMDYPVEHLVDSVLKRMNRRQNWDSIRTAVEQLREQVPGIALRTSLIVGFPGETAADFELLLERVKEIGFDRLGAFAYSDGEDVPARKLPDQVPPPLRQERYERLMELQRELSLTANQRLIGTTQEVLFDEIENGVSIGRTRFDAPEIDNSVLVAGEIAPGSLLRVKITDGTEYDLYGLLAENSLDAERK